MRTKLFKNPTVLCLNEERARHLMSGSRLPCVFFDDRSCVLVLSYSRKLRMTQMVELRFILYPFVAWATKSQDEGCFLEEAEKAKSDRLRGVGGQDTNWVSASASKTTGNL